MKPKILLLATIFLTSCSHRAHPPLTKVHLTHANGLTQTITAKDRLKFYTQESNLSQQPYTKVIRLYGPQESKRVLTSYHPNGQLFQRLECENNQAKGEYLEWSPQGQVRVKAHLIGGPPEVDEKAQASWIFHGFNQAFDAEGKLIAEFYYENGLLEKEGKTFHSCGPIHETFSYEKGLLHGPYVERDPSGSLQKKIEYDKGLLHGAAFSYWSPGVLFSEELFSKGQLLQAFYFSPQGHLLSKIADGDGTRIFFKEEKLYRIEYQKGIENGKVEVFTPKGDILLSSFYQIDGVKTKEEVLYDPNTQKPKLKIEWQNGEIQGKITTWYATGELESQREMTGNKKQGFYSAYYPEGDLMLLEEYDQDKLVRGQYFKKGVPSCVSEVNRGFGEAFLFSPEGLLKKRILYEEGSPLE